jgi:sulfinoalanine decarboxylase/sulfinoalanine decarboxylase/aspartate 1-decarboxylase
MSNNIKEDLQLFNELINAFLEDEHSNPISESISPSEVFDVLDIKLNNNPAIDTDFQLALKDLMLKSTKSSSKLFFNQLFGGRHSKAVLGDLLAVFLNNSMATYKIADRKLQ